jgi:hypothetical protein
VTNASRIDFTGAHIGIVPRGKRPRNEDTKVPVRLRACRKIAEETKNHDLERDLYTEERKAERGNYLRQRLEDLKRDHGRIGQDVRRLIATILWSAVMVFYGALANYGRSFVRPLGWLILSGLLLELRQDPRAADAEANIGMENSVQIARAMHHADNLDFLVDPAACAADARIARQARPSPQAGE